LTFPNVKRKYNVNITLMQSLVPAENFIAFFAVGRSSKIEKINKLKLKNVILM